MVSGATPELCAAAQKQLQTIQMNKPTWLPVKLYLYKQAVGQMQPTGYSLM